MDFRILFVTNRLKVDIQDDINRLKEYERANTGLKISHVVREVDFDLKHKSFGVRRLRADQLVDVYGLDGAKTLLRESGVVQRNIYHAVVFVYDLEDTGWFKDHIGDQIGHWTHFQEIYPGTEFIEVATTEGWDEIGDVLRVLTHELRHCYGNRLKRQGINYTDPMDLTPVPTDCETHQPDPEGGCSAQIPYYKEYEINHPHGNRAIANAALSPYWEKVATHPQSKAFLTLLQSIVAALVAVIAAITKSKETKEKEEVTKNRLEEWALVIREFEGWYPGSRSYRNNNPGNLRWSPFQLGTDDGNYSTFVDYATGWKALIHQLTIAVDGRSNVYKPHDTLLDFFKKYAPGSDNNHPERYAQYVADRLEVPVSTQISTLAGL